MIRVRLLGPVDIEIDGGTRPVRGLRRKAILAVLALNLGEAVSTDRLIDAVWGDDAPSTPVNTLQSHVSYLRGVFGRRDTIRARPPGYLLDLGPDGTDVAAAEDLIAQAGRTADPSGQAGQLRAALALWRGTALADVAGLAVLEQEAARLEQLWLRATHALTAARLALGEHHAVIADLERLGREYPLDEQVHRSLLLALYRSGRQADALAAYHRLRRRLADELGIDPGPALRELEGAILRHDPELSYVDTSEVVVGRPAGTGPDRPVLPVPAQLPVAVRDFAGRRGEVARLDALAADAAAGRGVVIVTVSGTAGVGKTSLAIHWSHAAADQFPDGQLYVNLRGFAPGGGALDPAEALHRFLTAFGVPTEQIPAGVDARAALYRTVLAGRRVLVLLDNARDADQVRPLLPGAPGCLVLITSRSSLAGLAAAEGAHPISLDVLSPADARTLLASRLGADRVAAAPGDVDEIIAHCARLPLALAIASARPQTTPARVAAELRASAGCLDAFAVPGDATNVTAVLSWSYTVLSEPAARLFRLIGCHPGADLTLPVAASLTGQSPALTRTALFELVDAHLLDEPVPARYAGHDLLRAYAGDCAQEYETAADRDAAARRLVDHYVHAAYRADRLVYPTRVPLWLADPVPGVQLPELSTVEESWAWLDAEQANLVAAQRLAATHGWADATWHLAWGLTTLLQRRGRPQDLYRTWTTALDRLDPGTDALARLTALRHLGEACARMDRFTEADHRLREATVLADTIDDPVEQAQVHRTAARAYGRRGDDAAALEHATRALELFERAGPDQPADQIASASNAVGWYAARLGDAATAGPHLRAALDLARELGDRLVEAHTMHSLGYLAQRTGRHRDALDLFRDCLDLARDNGDTYNTATTLDHLGDSYAALGEHDEARCRWSEALLLCEAQSRRADVDRLHAKLTGLTAVAVA